MSLKKKLRNINKTIEIENSRSSLEIELIEDFIKQKLHKAAEDGKTYAIFCATCEYVVVSEDEMLQLNLNDFEVFSRKHKLRICYLDNDLKIVENKEKTKKIILFY